jgi:hypothetical protein
MMKKPVWDTPSPKGKSEKLSPAKKAAAKKAAAKAGRPYPNLVDNMNAAKKKSGMHKMPDGKMMKNSAHKGK